MNCGVENCQRKHKAKGYCELHYNRLKKHGNTHTKMVANKVSPIVEKLIVESYLNKVPCYEIASNNNINIVSIFRILKRNNITQRNGQKTFNIDLDFFKIQSDDLFWYIGLMSADGSVRKDNTFSITQSNDHGHNMLSYIKSKIKYEGEIKTRKNINALTITNLEIKNILEYYGVVNNKTLINIPKNIPDIYIKSYLRGYFEGDGSVGIYKIGGSKNLLSASFVGTHELIEYIKQFLPERYVEHNIKRCKNLKEIRYAGRFAHRFLDWLYSNSYLYKGKKYSIYNNWLKMDHQFIRYDKLKEKAKNLFLEGYNCMQISKLLDMKFQTIYEWKDTNFKKSIDMEIL